MLINIEAERGRSLKSKEAISKELGITVKTYNGYVNGTPVPHTILVKMANMFGCTVDYLLGLSDARAR